MKIQKKILLSWMLITGSGIFISGILFADLYPSIIKYTYILALPLGAGFLTILYYLDKDYKIFSENINTEIINKYIEIGNMNEVARILDTNVNEVRREIIKFLKLTIQ